MQLYDTYNKKTISGNETNCYFKHGCIYKSVRITVSKNRKRISMTWHYNEKKSLLENWMDLISVGKMFESDPVSFLKEMETIYAKQITVQELYPQYLEAEKTRGKITHSGIKERQCFYDRMLLPFLVDYAVKHPYFKGMEVPV